MFTLYEKPRWGSAGATGSSWHKALQEMSPKRGQGWDRAGGARVQQSRPWGCCPLVPGAAVPSSPLLTPTPPSSASTVPRLKCHCHIVTLQQPRQKCPEDAEGRLKRCHCSGLGIPAFPLQPLNRPAPTPEQNAFLLPLHSCSHGNQPCNKQTQQLLFFFLIQTTSERSWNPPQIYDS